MDSKSGLVAKRGTAACKHTHTQILSDTPAPKHSVFNTHTHTGRMIMPAATQTAICTRGGRDRKRRPWKDSCTLLANNET